MKCSFIIHTDYSKKKKKRQQNSSEMFCCADVTCCRESIQRTVCPLPLFCFSCIVMLLMLQDVKMGGVSFGVRHRMDSLNRYPV